MSLSGTSAENLIAKQGIQVVASLSLFSGMIIERFFST